MRLSVIIPVFNQAALLERHLPIVAGECAGLKGGAEVLVVDDGSDREAGAIEQITASIGAPARLLRKPHLGFAAACNSGADVAQGTHLLFLNSDVHGTAGSIESLVSALEGQPALFAVSPRLWNLEENFCESLLRLRWNRGVFDVLQPERWTERPPESAAFRAVAYACGGAFVCRRDRFLKLGGFSPLLRPFYWEDADLGWRARCHGWGAAEHSGARMLHDHGATIQSLHAARSIRIAYERNRLLFTWTHLRGAAGWAQHLAWLPLRWSAAAARGRPEVVALPLALLRIAPLIRLRKKSRAWAVEARRLWSLVRAAGPDGWPGQKG